MSAWFLRHENDFFTMALIWAIFATTFSIYVYEKNKDTIFSKVVFLTTEGEIKRFRAFDSSSSDGTSELVVNMEVEYSVDGKLYSTNSFSFGHHNRDMAKKMMRQFNNGNSQTKVWYNPEKPEIAVLDFNRDFASFNFWLFLLGSLVPLLVNILIKIFRYALNPAFKRDALKRAPHYVRCICTASG